MTTDLNSQIIQKLGHKIPEIRKRALDYIDKKFTNENSLNFNAPLLTKWLIRWFGLKPLMNEQIVLNLIHVILTGKYGKEVIKTLGTTNLKKQLEKIDQLIHNTTHKEILFEIMIVLELFSTEENSIVIDKESLNFSIDNLVDEQILHRNDEADASHNFISVYEKPWESMNGTDLNALKLLKISLKSSSSTENTEDFEKSLHATLNAINDFPAEYFLQPPYIYDCLKNLLKTLVENAYQCANVLDLFSKLTIELEKRINIRRMSRTYIWHIPMEENLIKNQITISHYCFELLQLCLNIVRDLLNNYQGHLVMKCYTLMFDILSLMECDVMLEFPFESILEEFGFLAKFLRQSSINNDCKSTQYTNRINYFLTLLLISKLLLCSNTKATIYNAKEYASASCNIISNRISSSDKLAISFNVNNVWLQELEMALLDFSLEECHTNIYDIISAAINTNQSANYEQVLMLRENIKILSNSIDLLKNVDAYSNKELIFKGFYSIDALALHKSVDLVERLFHAISNVSANFDNDNLELKKCSIDLFLRLLSTGDIDCKRKIYNLCASKVKYYFGSLLSGEICISSSNSSVNQIKNSFFGLPLTTNILNEFICFGYECKDQVVKNCAENILSLLLKSKNVLKQNWSNLLEILIPTFPLLQCHATYTTNFGKQIIDMFNIDSDLPLLQIVKGNITFLFNNEKSVRDEAMSRLLHLLSINSDAHLYLPQIINISDVISNNLCLLDTQYDIQKNLVFNQYEPSTIYPLIELLESSNIEPIVRKTTLNQINVMARDPQLTAIINERNGLYLILSALDDSLKERHSTYYPDSAIPAIGIISKLCLQIMRFRRELSNEINVYYLILRTLLLFHQHPGLKIDCAVTLFLLVLNDYTIGSNEVSIPEICTKLKIPFKCNKRWKQSQFNKSSTPLDEFLLHSNNDSETIKSDSFSSDILLSTTNGPLKPLDKQHFWQYIRMYFAHKWFDGFQNIFENSKITKLEIPNYDLAINSLDFDQQLKLTTNDIIVIQSTLPNNSMKYWLQVISNATNHGDVLFGLSQIENFILLSEKNGLPFNDFKNVTMRFVSAVPNTYGDEVVFKSLLNVLEKLIDREDFNHWIINEMDKKNNGFINVLNYGKCSSSVYYENCRFIGTILKKSFTNDKTLLIKDKFLTILLKLLDQKLVEIEIDKLRSLLLLLRKISSIKTTTIDDEHGQIITEKLFDIISAIRLTTKNVTNCIKMCLISIGNIMSCCKITINRNNLKLLSGLCGQSDYEIRTFSWNVLLQVSSQTSLSGAISILQDLSFLPGGFLSCCLSTCLDPHECSAVREASGYVFANFISFFEVNIDSATITGDHSPIDSVPQIIQIIKQQRFLYEVTESFKCIWIYELVEPDICGPITTCNMIRTYCMILSNLLRLDDELLTDYHELRIIVDMARLIPMILMNTQQSSILMLSEICTFLSLCFRLNSDSYEQISVQEHTVVVALIEALNLDLYDSCSNDIRSQTLINVLNLLQLLTKNECAFQLFCTTLTDNNYMQHFLNLSTYSLKNKDFNDLSMTILDFLVSAMLVNERENSEYNQFTQLLDTCTIDSLQLCKKSSKDKVTDEILSASQQIFIQLIEFFETTKKKPKQWKLVNKTIATLLKLSPNARRMATKRHFFAKILQELDAIHQSLQVDCPDYIIRQSELKKNKAIGQYKMLYGIILNWYYMDCLADLNNIQHFCDISLKLWPWITVSFSFQVIFLNCLAFLSEDSVIVCQLFSSYHIGKSQTILHKVIEYVQTETARAKHPTTDLSGFSKAMRILTNCCSCIEGRSLLTKMNIVDSINRLHPIVTKQQKIWNIITLIWLQFYEVYTRYPDINTTKHLSILCIFVNKSDRQIRFTALLILRNMAFGSSNKSALLANEEYLNLVKNIIEDGEPDEQYIIITSLWKLIANNYKSKHTIKNSLIPKKLSNLAQRLTINSDTDEHCKLLQSLQILTECLYN